MENPTIDDSGIIRFNKSKYKQYVNFNQRFDSFDGRTISWPVFVCDLAESGFFYKGQGDSVYCFHCGVHVRMWRSGDDPFKEHAKFSSECKYILLAKGAAFVKQAGDHKQQSIQQTPPAPDLDVYTDLIESATQRGNAPDKVKTALRVVLYRRELQGDESTLQNSHRLVSSKSHANYERIGVYDVSILELDNVLSELEHNASLEAQFNIYSNNESDGDSDSSSSQGGSLNTDDISALQTENETLKHRIVCKLCNERTGDVLNVPCGHLFCAPCTVCSQRCLKCDQNITGRIKTLDATFTDMRIT